MESRDLVKTEPRDWCSNFPRHKRNGVRFRKWQSEAEPCVSAAAQQQLVNALLCAISDTSPIDETESTDRLTGMLS